MNALTTCILLAVAVWTLCVAQDASQDVLDEFFRYQRAPMDRSAMVRFGKRTSADFDGFFGQADR
ncbi:hypothetical protein AAVH_16094 [Aphelenchoides avenae]|nr:hypothetical protein AAVH_16094 [Aphelenchus avenae]